MSRIPLSPSTMPWVVRAPLLFMLLLVPACGGGNSPGGPTGPVDGVAILSGYVRSAGSSSLLANATVKIGANIATTDANGHFELTGLKVGAATARAERPGFVPSEAALTLNAGGNTHDFALSAQEIYQIGAYAVLVPAGVAQIRGAIVTLGGPTTSGFVTGGSINGGQPNEAALQALGADLRFLARSAGVALLGTAQIALANNTESDSEILAALRSAALASGHPELEAVPLVMFGLSAGAREAAGLASRLPQRTIGLLARVPVGVTALTEATQLAVPTFIMQGELDDALNASVQPVFSSNRAQGGLWALAVEAGATHSTVSVTGNAASTGWIRSALMLRLPSRQGDPLVTVNETVGWLGNQATLEIARWGDYVGDRTTASWLPTDADAVTWKQLGTLGGGSGGGSSRLPTSSIAPER
ncbi:MAG: carboxypeptidase regulatory-like domain-containing protein [Gemmatimonadales bacterium]